jgi:hypothetical protein
MKRLIAAACLAAALALPARAGEIADAGAAAEALASEGKFDEALAALTEAQAKLWDLSPMFVRKAFFVAAEPGGFGIYEARANSTFPKAEKLLIYAEPVGFGYNKEGELFVVDISMDFDILDPAGKSVAAQQAFGNLGLKSQVPNREFFAKITYDFSGLNAGDYTVVTTLNDKVSGESVEIKLPFTLTE